jgi:sugar/nucleoside kinase (ribokinase family)
VRLANAAGALAVTVTGAEPALPHRAAVERLLAQTNRKQSS